jgi:hypothetical protein
LDYEKRLLNTGDSWKGMIIKISQFVKVRRVFNLCKKVGRNSFDPGLKKFVNGLEASFR